MLRKCLIAAVSLLLASAVAAQPGVTYVAGEALVVPSANAASSSRASARALCAAAGVEMLSVHRNGRVWRVGLSDGESVEAAVARLGAEEWVLAAQPNLLYRIPAAPHPPVEGPRPDASTRFSPNDPSYALQWHFPRIGAESAWDVERGDASVVVAVIDTGVGYRDSGGNFARMEDLAATTFVAGYDFIQDDAYPDDLNGHGTHVCGTIAQATNNAVGVAGLAHGCAIMPVRVLDADGAGATLDVVAGIDFAVANGADVLNLSLGASSGAPIEEQALADAVAAGAVPVAAAGNESASYLNYPAAYDTVIAVGAARYDKTRVAYSNFGAGIDLVAPGGDLSVDQDGDGNPDGVYQNTFVPSFGDAPTVKNKYYYMEGTSQATPHVAATVALLLSHGFTGTPRFDAVLSLLENTAEDVGAAGYDLQTGYGFLRADQALAAVATTYLIGGTVSHSGAGVSGVTVTAGTQQATTASDGTYTITGLTAGSYTVTPSHPNRAFTPSTRTVSLTANTTGVDFEASAPVYSISGTVTYGGSGLESVSVSTGTVTATTDATGAYTLSGLTAGTYTVTPTLASHGFSPATRSITIASSNQTGMDFAAGRTYAPSVTSGIRMVSVPATPLSGAGGVTDVLGAGADGWYTYDPANAWYVKASTPEVGRGYFVRIPEGATAASLTGVPPSSAYVELALPAGYSQIGNPRPVASLTLSDLAFREGATTMTFVEAVTSGAVRGFGWVWDSSAGEYLLLHGQVAGAATSVGPCEGLFLEALRAVTVLVPTAAGSTSARAAQADGPAIGLSLTSADGARSTAYVGCSQTLTAEAEAPPSPVTVANAPSLRVVLEDGRTAGVAFRREAGNLEFTLRAENLAPGETRIEAAGLEALSRDWNAFLTDETTGRTVSLRNIGWLEFGAQDGETRIFTVSLRKREQGLRLRVAAADTARGVSTVRYELSATAEVEAEVLNMAGRVVARLDEGAAPVGARELSWNGRTLLGSAAPRGEYRIVLTARADTGEVATATVRVVR